MGAAPKGKGRYFLAAFCIAIGAYLLLIATGVLSSFDEPASAPMWVLAACGFAIAIAGCMVIVGIHSRVNDLLAAILLLLFSSIGFWVSFSPSEGFSGGIPFLPDRYNIAIGRVLFFGGALMTLAMSVWALRRFLRSSE